MRGSKLAYGSGVFLSMQEKQDIPRLGALPNSKMPILFFFQAITTSTTFWQNKWLECNTPVLTPFALNVCDVYIVMNHVAR